MPPPPRGSSGSFELETDRGIRLLEFDPDVFRGRDVRILVDGKRVAELPFPKPASPYHEVAFGSVAGARGWGQIRADAARTVRRRAALGWAWVGTCYAVAFGVVLAVAVVVGRR
jgi:hypothetical protein